MICKKCGNDLEDLRGDSWDDDECPYCNIVETRADDRDRSVIIGGNKYKMKNIVAITKDPYDGTALLYLQVRGKVIEKVIRGYDYRYLDFFDLRLSEDKFIVDDEIVLNEEFVDTIKVSTSVKHEVGYGLMDTSYKIHKLTAIIVTPYERVSISTEIPHLMKPSIMMNEKTIKSGTSYYITDLRNYDVPKYKVGLISMFSGIREVGEIKLKQNWLLVNKEVDSDQMYTKDMLSGYPLTVCIDSRGNEFIRTHWGCKPVYYDILLRDIPVQFVRVS